MGCGVAGGGGGWWGRWIGEPTTSTTSWQNIRVVTTATHHLLVHEDVFTSTVICWRGLVFTTNGERSNDASALFAICPPTHGPSSTSYPRVPVRIAACEQVRRMRGCYRRACAVCARQKCGRRSAAARCAIYAVWGRREAQAGAAQAGQRSARQTRSSIDEHTPPLFSIRHAQIRRRRYTMDGWRREFCRYHIY